MKKTTAKVTMSDHDMLEMAANDVMSSNAVQSNQLVVSNYSSSEFQEYSDLTKKFHATDSVPVNVDVKLTAFVQNRLENASGARLSGNPMPVAPEHTGMVLNDFNCVTDHCSDFIFRDVFVCKTTYKWLRMEQISAFDVESDLASCQSGLNEIKPKPGSEHIGQLKAYGLAYWMCPEDEENAGCNSDGDLKNFDPAAYWGLWVANKVRLSQEVRRYYQIHNTLAETEYGILDASNEIPEGIFKESMDAAGTWQFDNYCNPYSENVIGFLQKLKRFKCEDFNRMVIGWDVYEFMKANINFNVNWNGARNIGDPTLEYLAYRLGVDEICVPKTRVNIKERDDEGNLTGEKKKIKLWNGSILWFNSNPIFGTTDCPESTFAFSAKKGGQGMIVRAQYDPMKGYLGSMRLSAVHRTGDEIPDPTQACKIINLTDPAKCKLIVSSMIPTKSGGIAKDLTPAEARKAKAKRSDQIANEIADKK